MLSLPRLASISTPRTAHSITPHGLLHGAGWAIVNQATELAAYIRSERRVTISASAGGRQPCVGRARREPSWAPLGVGAGEDRGLQWTARLQLRSRSGSGEFSVLFSASELLARRQATPSQRAVGGVGSMVLSSQQLSRAPGCRDHTQETEDRLCPMRRLSSRTWRRRWRPRCIGHGL